MVRRGDGYRISAPGPGRTEACQPLCENSPVGLADTGACDSGADPERGIFRHYSAFAHIAANTGGSVPGKGVPGLAELK